MIYLMILIMQHKYQYILIFGQSWKYLTSRYGAEEVDDIPPYHKNDLDLVKDCKSNYFRFENNLIKIVSMIMNLD
jgi:hypothetical protein